MHILLTRPLEDSQELIINFRKLGHKVSHLPLIIDILDYIYKLVAERRHQGL